MVLFGGGRSPSDLQFFHEFLFVRSGFAYFSGGVEFLISGTPLSCYKISLHRILLISKEEAQTFWPYLRIHRVCPRNSLPG